MTGVRGRLRGRAASRLVRTAFQFKELRLQLAGGLGLALLAIGIAADPLSKFGVVLVSLATGVLASTLVAAIALEREEFLQVVLRFGIQDVFADRSKEFEDGFWTSLVDSAQHQYRILGVANHGYLRSPVIRDETSESFERAIVKRDVSVEILWLNPEHELATIREEEEGDRGTRDDTIDSIEFFWALRAQLPPEKRAGLVLREHTAMPTCGITWADDLLVVTHYLSTKLNLGSPGVVLGPSMSLFDRLSTRLKLAQSTKPEITRAYVANYREIAQMSSEITQERVTELLAKRGTWGGDSAGRRSEADIRAAEGET